MVTRQLKDRVPAGYTWKLTPLPPDQPPMVRGDGLPQAGNDRRRASLIDAIKHYRPVSGEDLTTAVAVVDLVAPR